MADRILYILTLYWAFRNLSESGFTDFQFFQTHVPPDIADKIID